MKIIKELISTDTALIVNGQQEKSGFDISIEKMDEKTAAQIIKDLQDINQKVRSYRDSKR